MTHVYKLNIQLVKLKLPTLPKFSSYEFTVNSKIIGYPSITIIGISFSLTNIFD